MPGKRKPLRFLFAAAVVLIAAGCEQGRSLPPPPGPPVPGVESLEYYVSSVDGSNQPYGLYTPANFNPGAPHAVVFFGHGYGGSASATFSQYQKDFADAHGWLLVNLHGRKILFYDGPAEVEVDDVLADLETTCAVDRRRLFFEGSSMGATGAFRLGARQPGKWAGVAGCDGWTDFREWHRHWYAPAVPDEWEVYPSRFHLLEAASPLFYAENFARTPLYLVVDSGDSTVLPENGIKLHNRLIDLGINHDYELNAGGHCASYNKTKIYDFFASLGPVTYDHVQVKTRRLWHARDGWLAVTKFERWGRWAQASGDVSELFPFPLWLGVNCEVENVSQLAIYLAATGENPGTDFSLKVNGCDGGDFEVGNDPTLPDAVVDIAWSGGAVVSVTPRAGIDPFPPTGVLRKRPEQEGPICQALCRNIIAAYGTTHADPLVNQANLDEANLFASIWASDVSGSLTVIADTAVTAGDIAEHNLVLFGTEDSNMIIYDMYHDTGRAFTPPITIVEDDIHAGASEFAGSQYGAFFCYPNPLAPDRMVVISHRTIKNWFFDFEALGWYYPDYVIFDTTATLRLGVNGYDYPVDAFVLAGYYDANWDFSPYYDVSITTDSLTYSYGSDTKSIVTATVTDSATGTPVTGLTQSAFTASVDGLETSVTNWTDAGAGVYTFEVSIANLAVTAYYISVQVEANGKYGETWARIVIQ